MAKKNEEQELKAPTVTKKLGRTRRQAAVDGTPVPPRRTERITSNPYATVSATPTPYKMTPAAQKAAGVTKPTTLRTTRLKVDVVLIDIPSPVRLVPKKFKSILKGPETEAQAVQEDKIDDLAEKFDAPTSGTIQTKMKATMRGRKGIQNEVKKEAKGNGSESDNDEPLTIERKCGRKGKEPEVKKAVDEQTDSTDTDEPLIVKAAKRTTRANSQAAENKCNTLEIYEDEKVKLFYLDAVVPLSLQQKASSMQEPKAASDIVPEIDFEPDEATKLSQDEQETIQNLIIRVQNDAASANEKQLWTIEEEDLKRIQEEINKLKAETSAKSKTVAIQLLQGMLDVTSRFQEFRESYDKFLDDADRVGMVLDWGAKNEEASETDGSVDGEEEEDLDI
jgi:hypothetical protein